MARVFGPSLRLVASRRGPGRLLRRATARLPATLQRGPRGGRPAASMREAPAATRRGPQCLRGASARAARLRRCGTWSAFRRRCRPFRAAMLAKTSKGTMRTIAGHNENRTRKMLTRALAASGLNAAFSLRHYRNAACGRPRPGREPVVTEGGASRRRRRGASRRSRTRTRQPQVRIAAWRRPVDATAPRRGRPRRGGPPRRSLPGPAARRGPSRPRRPAARKTRTPPPRSTSPARSTPRSATYAGPRSGRARRHAPESPPGATASAQRCIIGRRRSSRSSRAYAATVAEPSTCASDSSDSSSSTS